VKPHSFSRPVVAALALLLLASPGEAQRFRGGGGGYSSVRPGSGLPDVPGGFTLCRLAYDSYRGDESGDGWDTDYPNADRNLPTRLSELTPTPVARWTDGQPGHAIVRPMDPELFECPFLYATDVGELGFSPEEADAIRNFLLKGGTFWADDFWGSRAWVDFQREMAQVLPEYVFEEIPQDHPLFQIVYDILVIPQIPSIQHWNRSGGGTSELGADSAVPSMRAIFDEEGQLLVIATHNTDISDGWEREAEDPRFFSLFSPDAYAIGINIAVWQMTH
jgi:hypothetical protein